MRLFTVFLFLRVCKHIDGAELQIVAGVLVDFDVIEVEQGMFFVVLDVGILL